MTDSPNEPVIAQKGPYEVELEEGQTYLWCTCGRSSTQPFCDRKAHKETAMRPHAFTAEKSGKAWLCGCKHTANAPFCDGTHKSV